MLVVWLLFSVYFPLKAQNCESFFYYSGDTTPNNINFFNTSYNSNSWEWSFGDNSFSTLQNPSHLYNFPGTYFVCLTSSDSNQSCSNVFCDSVTVQKSCTSYFSYFPGIVSNSISFYNRTYGIGFSASSSILWDLGDNTQSAEVNPIHIYSQVGLYYVCLTISDSAEMCFNTFCDSIFVTGNSNVNYSICDGSWNDSLIWSKGYSPLPNDTVIIANNVLLNININLIPSGMLVINPEGELCGHNNFSGQFLTFGPLQVNNLIGHGNCVNYAYVGTEGYYSGSGIGSSSWSMKEYVCIGCPSLCSPTNPCLSPNEESLSIYPNPTEGKITVTFKNPTNINFIEIFNMKGEKVYSISKTGIQYEIDLSPNPGGIYFAKIYSSTESFNRKILIQ